MAEGFGGGVRRDVRRISRRRFLYGAAAAFGGLSLAGCSGGMPLGGTGQIVHFWNLFGGGDGARLAEMQSNFVDGNPQVELESTTLTWGSPYYTKLSMSAVGGRPPEVAVMHQTRLGAYAPAGLLEPLDPEMLAEYDIGPDKFLPEVFDSAKFNGEIYAIPLDTHPQVMFYNTDIVKEAGLVDPDGNLKTLEGPDAVIDAFKRAKEVTGEQGVSFAPADGAVPWRLFYTLYGQLGGEIISPDASEVIMDRENAERAVEYLTEITVAEELTSANQDYPAAVAQFQSGNAGFHWNGEWEVTTFEDAGVPFSIVPFPNIFGNKVQADRHTFVIPRGVANDPRAMDGALTFVSSMMKNCFIWAQGGHIPAYLPVAESQEYKDLTPQSNYAEVADDVVLDPDAWFSGSGSTMETQAAIPLQQAMAGGIEPAEAVDRIRASMQELVDTPKPF